MTTAISRVQILPDWKMPALVLVAARVCHSSSGGVAGAGHTKKLIYYGLQPVI